MVSVTKQIIDATGRSIVAGNAAKANNRANRAEAASAGAGLVALNFVQRLNKANDKIIELRERIGEDLGIIKEYRNNVHGLLTDRHKAYAEIEKMSEIIRRLDPDNKEGYFSNVNAVAAAVNHHSGLALKDSKKILSSKSKEDIAFSKGNLGTEKHINTSINSRAERERQFKAAAEAGETKIIRPTT